MKKALEKLDMSMKQLVLELQSGKEDPMILSTLNEQYHACKVLLALGDDGINNTYYIKYSNMNDIELILTNAGYINKSKTFVNR